MKKKKYAQREMDVLAVLWDNPTGLSASDIANIDSRIDRNTINANLSKLLKKEAIKVKQVDMRGKALARVFMAALDREQFILQQYPDLETDKLLILLVRQENDHSRLDQLSQLIQERKKQLSLRKK